MRREGGVFSISPPLLKGFEIRPQHSYVAVNEYRGEYGTVTGAILLQIDFTSLSTAIERSLFRQGNRNFLHGRNPCGDIISFRTARSIRQHEAVDRSRAKKRL